METGTLTESVLDDEGTDTRRLALILESRRPGELPCVVPLDRSAVLGRGDDCDHTLVGPLASRRHARIGLCAGAAHLEDLGSKNGTFVNGKRLESPVSLHFQDVVRLGGWTGVVTSLSDEEMQLESPVRLLADSLLGGPATARAFEQLQRVAGTELRVMLIAETGCGKDVFARELHRLSGRAGKMVAMNCAAVPEQMAEGELFGYRRGAFTGADRQHTGHFRSAHEGTLFLDEVAELAPTIQAKMLRALEDRQVVPLGQSLSEPANARVVCAAQRPLHDYVEEGGFRADLYSRLNGLELHIPPLRHRREEVLPLLRHLIARSSQKQPHFAPEAAEQLLAYDWPLNVREVVQLAERFVSLHANEEVLRLAHLPERIATFSRAEASTREQNADGTPKTTALPPAGMPSASELAPRDQLAQKLLQTLQETNGNVSAAAERLGITRPRAYRLLKRLPGADPEALRLGNHLDRSS